MYFTLIVVTKKCSKRLKVCSKIKKPYFNIYPVLYEENKHLQEFKDKRSIMSWEQYLNSYK